MQLGGSWGICLAEQETRSTTAGGAIPTGRKTGRG